VTVAKTGLWTTPTCDVGPIGQLAPQTSRWKAIAESALEPGEGFVTNGESALFFAPHFVVSEPWSTGMGLVASTDRRLMYVRMDARAATSWRWSDILTIEEGRRNRHNEVVLTFRDRSDQQWRWRMPQRNASLLVLLHAGFSTGASLEARDEVVDESGDEARVPQRPLAEIVPDLYAALEQSWPMFRTALSAAVHDPNGMPELPLPIRPLIPEVEEDDGDVPQHIFTRGFTAGYWGCRCALGTQRQVVNGVTPGAISEWIATVDLGSSTQSLPAGTLEPFTPPGFPDQLWPVFLGLVVAIGECALAGLTPTPQPLPLEAEQAAPQEMTQTDAQPSACSANPNGASRRVGATGRRSAPAQVPAGRHDPSAPFGPMSAECAEALIANRALIVAEFAHFTETSGLDAALTSPPELLSSFCMRLCTSMMPSGTITADAAVGFLHAFNLGYEAGSRALEKSGTEPATPCEGIDDETLESNVSNYLTSVHSAALVDVLDVGDAVDDAVRCYSAMERPEWFLSVPQDSVRYIVALGVGISASAAAWDLGLVEAQQRDDEATGDDHDADTASLTHASSAESSVVDAVLADIEEVFGLAGDVLERDGEGLTWITGDAMHAFRVGEPLERNGTDLIAVSMTTDVLHDVEEDHPVLSMAGPLNQHCSTSSLAYDPVRRTLFAHMSQLVPLDRRRAAELVLFRGRAVLQAWEVTRRLPTLAQLADVKVPPIEPYRDGSLNAPEDRFDFVERAISRQGSQTSAFSGAPLRTLLDVHPDAFLIVNGDDEHIVANIAYKPPAGDTITDLMAATTLAVFGTDTPHPSYGSGLLVLLRVPTHLVHEEVGALALGLNRAETLETVPFSSTGAWCEDPGEPGGLAFCQFWPSALSSESIVPTIAIDLPYRSIWVARYLEGH